MNCQNDIRFKQKQKMLIILKRSCRRIAGARTTVTQTMTLSGEIDPITGRIKTEYGHIDPETG